METIEKKSPVREAYTARIARPIEEAISHKDIVLAYRMLFELNGGNLSGMTAAQAVEAYKILLLNLV
jgi:hypothetical protein